MRCNTRFLYSVWRNKDDQLIILDGTADECARLMGVDRLHFYHICKNGTDKWTIIKTPVAVVKADSEL